LKERIFSNMELELLGCSGWMDAVIYAVSCHHDFRSLVMPFTLLSMLFPHALLASDQESIPCVKSNTAVQSSTSMKFEITNTLLQLLAHMLTPGISTVMQPDLKQLHLALYPF
jgi:hypothetical protein